MSASKQLNWITPCFRKNKSALIGLSNSNQEVDSTDVILIAIMLMFVRCVENSIVVGIGH